MAGFVAPATLHRTIAPLHVVACAEIILTVVANMIAAARLCIFLLKG
jgi:hypothetical protein